MFGINISEILLILMISLLIFGPEQLPIIARKIGKLIAYIIGFKKNLAEQIYEQIGIDQIKQIKTDLETTVAQLKTTIINQSSSNQNTNEEMVTESDSFYHEYSFLYQPELEFDYQPELFDEN